MALAQVDWQSLTQPGSVPHPEQIYQAVGCPECRESGYRGRAGVYEIMRMSDDVKALISPDTDVQALRREALKDGMHSLRLSGALKVAEGLTTMEEVLRVTPQNEVR